MLSKISNIDTTAPAVAVIIGCWAEHTQQQHRDCYQRIINFVHNSPFISDIVLSGNHCNLDSNTQGPNQWYSNSQRVFYDEQGVEWVRKLWSLPQPASFATVEPSIRDHVWQKQCLAAWEQWQLEYLINHVFTQTQNIWYMGIGWSWGLRRDPLGWGQACDLIRHQHIRHMNILTSKSLILDNLATHEDFELSDFAVPDLSNDWGLISHDVYAKISLEW